MSNLSTKLIHRYQEMALHVKIIKPYIIILLIALKRTYMSNLSTQLIHRYQGMTLHVKTQYLAHTQILGNDATCQDQQFLHHHTFSSEQYHTFMSHSQNPVTLQTLKQKNTFELQKNLVDAGKTKVRFLECSIQIIAFRILHPNPQ